MPRLIKMLLLWLLLAVPFIALMLVPIFAASGLVAFIWNGAVLDTVLGDPPNRHHPAFWVFLLLMVAGMLIAAVLGYCLIALPAFAKFKRDGLDVQLDEGQESLLSFIGKFNRYLARRMYKLACTYAALMEWLAKH